MVRTRHIHRWVHDCPTTPTQAGIAQLTFLAQMSILVLTLPLIDIVWYMFHFVSMPSSQHSPTLPMWTATFHPHWRARIQFRSPPTTTTTTTRRHSFVAFRNSGEITFMISTVPSDQSPYDCEHQEEGLRLVYI